MPIICPCAVVACGGDHCPVGHAMQQVAREIGQPVDPNNSEHSRAVLDRFYADTEQQYQQNCAYRHEPRRRCCSVRLQVEMYRIHKQGSCHEAPETGLPAEVS